MFSPGENFAQKFSNVVTIEMKLLLQSVHVKNIFQSLIFLRSPHSGSTVTIKKTAETFVQQKPHETIFIISL